MNRLLTLVFIAFLGFSCSSIKYTSDQMGGVDFEQYKTYKVVQFVNEEDLANEKYNMNQMNEQRLLNAIDKQASLRGMSKTEEPEVLIIWATGIDIQKSYETHTDYMGGPYMGYRGRYRGSGMASSYSTTQEYETEIGQLKIAVVDPKTKEMLWMGSAEGERGGKVKDVEKKINEIVGKIFEMYPLPIKE